MRRRTVVLLSIAGVLGLLAILGGVLTQRLLHTQAGLDFAIRQLDRLSNPRIEVTGARGTLAGPLEIERIVVDHESAHVDARRLRVVSHPGSLVAGRLRLDDLSIASVDVRLKPRPPRPKTEPHFLPAGLSIVAPRFRVNDIDLTLTSGGHVVAREAQGSLVMTHWRITVDPVAVRGPDGRLDGALMLRATEPLGLRSDLRGQWRFPGEDFEYRFRVATRGNLGRLDTEAALDMPAKLQFSGTLLDLTEVPRARGTLRLQDFDGTPWLPPGRIPRLGGSITLAAGMTGFGIDGTLTSPALPGQPVRLQGAGRVQGERRRIDVASFRVWLPRTGLDFASSGTVELPARDAPRGATPRLALTGGWTALRWPIDPAVEAVVTSAQGVYSLAGTLPYTFETRAEIAGASIPAGSLEAGGRVAQTGVQLERFTAYALRGRIDAQGALDWSGEQRWNFGFEARSLAIGELRPGIEGKVSAAGTIEGAGLDAGAEWTARLTSLSGTMMGRPLTGRGAIAHRAGVYELRGVRLANGASFADIDGRIGAEALDLSWNLDLRTLAIVAPGMRGQLQSQGTARGTTTRPRIDADAKLDHFEYGGVRVASATVRAFVDSSNRDPSRVAVEAIDVHAAPLQFDSMHATLEGPLSDHEFGLVFDSPGDEQRRIAAFRGDVRARGGLDLPRRTWTGDLTQADVAFADGDARLIQPAALVLGPALQRSAPLCLRTAGDARLCVEGEHQAAPRAWRVLYSAQDWPLKSVLRSLLGWREFDGRLQASGWAEQAPGRPWVGGSTVLVHEPSFDMPRNKFRTERIRLGSSQLDVFAADDAIRANMSLQVDESTQVTGEAHVDRRSNVDLPASTLKGRIEGRSEAIKVLPLFVPEIDRAEGRFEGMVLLAGTLGQPQFRGEFRARDGRLEFYRTNLIVTDLQADGSFTGDGLDFKARARTAKGGIAVDGSFAWPQGVMTGVMTLRGDQLLVADTPDYRVTASPDIRLYAGRTGYRVEGEVLVPSARISPREITTSVGTSPDERVVGIDSIDEGGTPAEPSTTDRLTSSIKVTLGDAVRVEAYGLKARLDGTVTVSTVPRDVARGNGTIRVAEGEYRAFGQDVRITKGLLKYQNSPLDEPQLEIVGERKIKDSDITVAVNVRGTLETPYVSITSTPSMSSNEALSYLLTGRSIDTLQSGEAANVNRAAENLAVSGGGMLLGGLGRRIGLDEVTVERTGEDDTSVVLGKFISPKLFVSYGISIAEAINTIKLRYTLNERWSVKAEAGLEQSADFEYRIER